MTENASDVDKVVQLRSDPIQNCKEGCSEPIVNLGLDERINHYFTHGYKLLHIGRETVRGQEGDWQQETVAFVGK